MPRIRTSKLLAFQYIILNVVRYRSDSIIQFILFSDIGKMVSAFYKYDTVPIQNYKVRQQSLIYGVRKYESSISFCFRRNNRANLNTIMSNLYCSHVSGNKVKQSGLSRCNGEMV